MSPKPGWGKKMESIKASVYRMPGEEWSKQEPGNPSWGSKCIGGQKGGSFFPLAWRLMSQSRREEIRGTFFNPNETKFDSKGKVTELQENPARGASRGAGNHDESWPKKSTTKKESALKESGMQERQRPNLLGKQKGKKDDDH